MLSTPRRCDDLDRRMNYNLEAARARARVLVDELPIVAYIVELEVPSTALYVSPQFEALFGYAPDECIGRHDFWVKRIAPDDQPGFLAAFQRMRDTREPMSVEYRVTSRAGGEVWVRDSASVAVDDDGELHVRGYLTEITREKELERQLAVERAQTDAFFRDSAIGLGITDADGRYIRVNGALARMDGVPAADHIGRTLRELAPELAAQATPLLERVAQTGEVIDQHEVEYDVAGRHYVVLVSYFPIETGGGTQYGRIVVDITDRRHAERDRAAAEQQYRRLVEQLPLVTYANALEPEFEHLYVSPQVEMFGYPAERFLEDPDLWDSLIHPEDLDAVRLGEKLARERLEPLELEYRVVRPDGSIVWVLDLMDTTLDPDGTPLFEQGFMLDITERKLSEGLFRAVFDNAFEAMTIADDEGRYVDVNPAACALFGRSRAQLVGLRARDLAESPADGEQLWRALLADGSVSGRHAVLRPGGEVRETEFAARANVLPGRHVAVLRDVTERRRLEAELWHSQRLESVGRLAGGVAHDFNNMLTAIRGYAELLLARTARDSTEHHHAREIDDAARRAAMLTAQLLAFGRRQVIRARPLDLNELVRNLIPMLSGLAGDGVEFELELEPALEVVRADPAQIEQVLVNLVENAAEAMEGAGRIAIRSRMVDVGSPHDLTNLRDGRYAVLSVEDSGHGIEAETLEHLFEPFFTTKDFGSGVGLGLATAYGIATQSGGTITVSTEPGAGSTFSIYLPASEATPNG
jgi:two-component system, cell cycle sensor histidine kinase and response regulator CckA